MLKYLIRFIQNLWNAQHNAKVAEMHEANFMHSAASMLAYFKKIEQQGLWTVYDNNIPETVFVAMCTRNNASISLMEKGGEVYITLGDWEKIIYSPSLGFIRQLVDHIESATDQPDTE